MDTGNSRRPERMTAIVGNELSRYNIDIAVERQGYADQHATKLFFSGLKAVYGPTSKSMNPIRAEDGTLLTDKAHILERWSAHFNQLLNKVSSVEEQAISDIRQRPIILALDGCPTVAETQKAIDQLQTGKATGADGIPPEIDKMTGLSSMNDAWHTIRWHFGFRSSGTYFLKLIQHYPLI